MRQDSIRNIVIPLLIAFNIHRNSPNGSGQTFVRLSLGFRLKRVSFTKRTSHHRYSFMPWGQEVKPAACRMRAASVRAVNGSPLRSAKVTLPEGRRCRA